MEGDLFGVPSNVLIVGDEDALDDTWTPRLHAAGADWQRVYFPPDDCAELDVTTEAGCARLGEWARVHAIRVVLFDALLDHLGGSDEFKPKAVLRNALRGVRRLAREADYRGDRQHAPEEGRGGELPQPGSRVAPVQCGQPVEPAARRAPRRRHAAGARTRQGQPDRAPPATRIRDPLARLELTAHAFNVPTADQWDTSDLKLDDLLPKGKRTRSHEQDERRDAVADALSDAPQSVRAIARAAGVPKSSVQRLLPQLADDGEAHQTPEGWVSHVPLPKGGTVGQDTVTRAREPNQGVPSQSALIDVGTPGNGHRPEHKPQDFASRRALRPRRRARARARGLAAAMTAAPAQLAIPLDSLRDDLHPSERAAVEARVHDEDDRRADHAQPASRCRCARSWPMGERCAKCGRDMRRAPAPWTGHPRFQSRASRSPETRPPPRSASSLDSFERHVQPELRLIRRGRHAARPGRGARPLGRQQPRRRDPAVTRRARAVPTPDVECPATRLQRPAP